jgi:hypothetical protein
MYLPPRLVIDFMLPLVTIYEKCLSALSKDLASHRNMQGGVRYVSNCVIITFKAKTPLGIPRHEWSIRLKWILRRYNARVWNVFKWFQITCKSVVRMVVNT